MKVFKFGGASVKTAEAVKNVGEVIKLHQDDLIIVISAMGKTTNNLENVVESYLNKDGKVEALTDPLFEEFRLNVTAQLSTLHKQLVATHEHRLESLRQHNFRLQEQLQKALRG